MRFFFRTSRTSLEWFPAATVATVAGWCVAISALGCVVATVPAEVLTALIGWRGVFVVIALIALAAGAWIWRAVPEMPRHTAPGGLAEEVRVLGRIMVHPGFQRLMPLVGVMSALNFTWQGLWAGPWLRDVAGLLRSIDYAAIAAMGGPSAASPLTVERRLALLSRFRRKSSRAFLEAYRTAHAASPRQWVHPDAELRLLDLFLLEKAAYEVRYEAANRPAWLAVPLRGLLRMFDSQQVAKPERVHA